MIRKSFRSLPRRMLVVIHNVTLVLALIVAPGDAQQPIQVARIEAPDPVTNNSFGISVAVSGNTLVGIRLVPVGGADSVVEALVFERTSTFSSWQLMRQIEIGPLNHLLPVSIALDADRLAVGILNSSADGIGLVAIHERNEGGPGAWGRVAQLHAPEPYDTFGHDLALEDDLLVVGAPAYTVARPRPGNVYVFRRQADGTWAEIAVLQSGDDTVDLFGVHVALSNQTILAVRAAFNVSRGYIFEPDSAGDWQRVASLDVSDPIGGADPDGSLEGDRAVLQTYAPSIGMASGIAVFERNAGGENQWGQVASTFLDPMISPNTSILAGDSIYSGAEFNETALRFDLDDSGAASWPLSLQFQPPPGEPADAFGSSLAVDRETIVVGAPAANGNVGAVYIYVDPIFAEGFETGDTSQWTATLP